MTRKICGRERILLDGCDLDIAGVVTAPLQRKEPEEDWLNANTAGSIPPALYGLYERASFLSFGTAPQFLSDQDNLLFSYFGLSLRSVMESLVDARDQSHSFAAAHELVYDPVKQIRGESWDKDANKRERRHFRDLLIALQTSLDALADVVAIFFPGGIKELEVGRAQFARVERWLQRPFVDTKLIVTPSEFFLKRLYDALKPLVQASAPETDWLPLMRMLRNKGAHLGTPLFRQVGLPQLGSDQQIAFIPRQWPYLWEQLIKPAGHAPPSTPLPQLLRDTLIHQDVVTYAQGLLAKVNAVVAAGTLVLNDAYASFRDLPENQMAMLQLKSNFEQYRFEHFANA
jgi:hypothetical protein